MYVVRMVKDKAVMPMMIYTTDDLGGMSTTPEAYKRFIIEVKRFIQKYDIDELDRYYTTYNQSFQAEIVSYLRETVDLSGVIGVGFTLYTSRETEHHGAFSCRMDTIQGSVLAWTLDYREKIWNYGFSYMNHI